MSGIVNLLTNRGEASGVDIIGEFKTWYGGPGDLFIWGNFGGGTVALETTPNGGVIIIPISGGTATDKAIIKFNLNHGVKIRATLTGTSSVSSGIFAEVF